MRKTLQYIGLNALPQNWALKAMESSTSVEVHSQQVVWAQPLILHISDLPGVCTA